MPSGKHKSRSLRRVFVRTPGGRTVLHYRKRKDAAARCGRCGALLKGVPRDISKLSKTEKRPERPYGGVLCSKCMREVIKESAREISE